MLAHRIHNAFKDIIFYDKGHSYFNSKVNRPLIPVTTAIREYFTPFDREYWLQVKAEERGITTEELSEEWDKIRDAGITHGNAVHDYAECLARRRITVDHNNDSVKQFFKDHSHWVTVEPELVVGDDTFGGQIDRLVYKGSLLGITDYKTDKKFETDTKYGKYLLPPFDDMPECELSKYTLQLNMYRHIFEKEVGIKIDFMNIIWFKREGGYEVHKVKRLGKIKKIWQQYHNILPS